ncbi:hypothetical protein AAZX31_06G173600 [Glycine max]
MKLAHHHRGPLLRHCHRHHHHHRPPHGGLVLRCHAPVAPERHATLRGGSSYCDAISKVRSSRVISTLMPKCRLGQVALTKFQLNPKKNKNVKRKKNKNSNNCC